MRKILIPLVAAAALAAPTSAFAHGGGHHHFAGGNHGAFAGLEKLSGTGTSFASTSATATGSLVQSVDHPNGSFSATLSTTWSSAQTKTFGGNGKNDNDGDDDNNGTAATMSISCAPATASVTLSNGTSTTATYTGKTCSWTKSGTTVYGFAGAASDGTRASLEENGTTVTGAVFQGHVMAPMGTKMGGVLGANVSFSRGSKHGTCNHH